MRRKRPSRRVFYILGLLVCGYLALCYVLATNYLRPARRVPLTPPEFSEVLVDTRFGATPSWATRGIHSGQPSPVIFLLAHGYGGSRDTWTLPMEGLLSRGFDSVALSMPGQDASPVSSVSFGVNEGHVIVDGVHWLKARFPKHKIVVLGLSMGGAATWLATEEDPKIDGVITDAAFARFDESMDAFFNRKVPGGQVLFAPVVWMAQALSGLNPSSVVPLNAAKRWKGKPALVIQGTSDTLVVPSHGQRLSAAAGCPIWLVPGAEHAKCFEVDPQGYLRHLVEFAQALEGKEKPAPH